MKLTAKSLLLCVLFASSWYFIQTSTSGNSTTKDENAIITPGLQPSQNFNSSGDQESQVLNKTANYGAEKTEDGSDQEDTQIELGKPAKDEMLSHSTDGLFKNLSITEITLIDKKNKFSLARQDRVKFHYQVSGLPEDYDGVLEICFHVRPSDSEPGDLDASVSSPNCKVAKNAAVTLTWSTGMLMLYKSGAEKFVGELVVRNSHEFGQHLMTKTSPSFKVE